MTRGCFYFLLFGHLGPGSQIEEASAGDGWGAVFLWDVSPPLPKCISSVLWCLGSHKSCSEGHSFIAGREVHTYSEFLYPSRLTSHTFTDSHSPHKHAPRISVSSTHTHAWYTCVHISPYIFASYIQKHHFAISTQVSTHTQTHTPPHTHTHVPQICRYNKGTAQATYAASSQADPAFFGGPREEKDLLVPTANSTRVEH